MSPLSCVSAISSLSFYRCVPSPLVSLSSISIGLLPPPSSPSLAALTYLPQIGLPGAGVGHLTYRKCGMPSLQPFALAAPGQTPDTGYPEFNLFEGPASAHSLLVEEVLVLEKLLQMLERERVLRLATAPLPGDTGWVALFPQSFQFSPERG